MSGLLERAEEELRRAERGGDFLAEFGRWRRAGGNGKDDRAEASADGTAGDSASLDWPEPKPLPDRLSPVPAFDFLMLPDTLKPWATDICERVQCPPDFVAVTIMTGLGSIIGRKLGIRP